MTVQHTDEISSNEPPIVFLLGPSGSGKSLAGEYIADDLNFVHFEIDTFPIPDDGIDLAGLRAEWNAFLNDIQPGALASAVRNRIAAQGQAGAVMTFPSRLVLSLDQIVAAERAGITTAILYGTGAACLKSFLDRERKSGRNLDVNHWIANNAMTYAQMSKPEYEPYRLAVYTADGRIPLVALVNAVRHRLRMAV